MKVLVVVDMQNEFISWLPEEKKDKLVDDMAAYINQRKKDSLIVFTQDTHDKRFYSNTFESKKYPIHCEEGSEGWNIHPKLTAAASGASYSPLVLQKFTYAMNHTALTKIDIFASEILRVNSVDDSPQFEVCGLTTDICVLANVVALNAFFSLSDITVLENLTYGTSRSKTLDALSVMDSMGIILKDAEIKEEEDE
jgi:nicotinamidase-related amidase